MSNINALAYFMACNPCNKGLDRIIMGRYMEIIYLTRSAQGSNEPIKKIKRQIINKTNCTHKILIKRIINMHKDTRNMDKGMVFE